MRQIRSRDNTTLKRLRALARESQTRHREQRTLIEGEHLCRAWLDARRTPVRAVIADDGWHGAGFDACLQRLAALDVELVEIPADWMKDLSASDTPPRLVCEVAIEVPAVDDAADASACDVVLLDAVQDPGNAGAILRTAAAAGVTRVVAGNGTATLWSPKVLRAAMGAHVALDIVEGVDLAGWIEASPLHSIGMAIDGAQELLALDLRRPLAWAFGNEGNGLQATTLAAVASRVRIDQAAAVESLNVAAAAAVCLFEMRRQRRQTTRS
ncbi:RNA methyltransferase [soil metagenome]